MPVRIVFFGNSASAFTRCHLDALLEFPRHLIALVDIPTAKRSTTNPVIEQMPDFAATANELQIRAFDPGNPNSEQFIKKMNILAPDLFIAVGYPLILKPPLLELPRILAANFHASLLPDYRGKHPVFWTLRAGERWAGLTVHAMDTGIDTGDILYQVKVRTRRDDSVAVLYNRIMDKSVSLVEQLITDAELERINRKPQPQGVGSYFSSINPEDFRLFWDWPAEKIRRNIIISPGKCFFDLGGQKVFFHDGEIGKLAHPVKPGTLLQIRRKWAVVATAQEAFSSSQINLSGRANETFAGFCRRMKLKPGDRLAA